MWDTSMLLKMKNMVRWESTMLSGPKLGRGLEIPTPDKPLKFIIREMTVSYWP